MNTTAGIELNEIQITRHEGSSRLCGKTHIFKTWEEASAFLWHRSPTFPRTGGYDKHGFRAIFADGWIYDGRLDCKHRDCEGGDLNPKQHIIDNLIWYAGLNKNPHCGDETYKEWMKQGGPEQIKEAREALEKYFPEVMV